MGNIHRKWSFTFDNCFYSSMHTSLTKFGTKHQNITSISHDFIAINVAIFRIKLRHERTVMTHVPKLMFVIYGAVLTHVSCYFWCCTTSVVDRLTVAPSWLCNIRLCIDEKYQSITGRDARSIAIDSSDDRVSSMHLTIDNWNTDTIKAYKIITNLLRSQTEKEAKERYFCACFYACVEKRSLNAIAP